jgi:putative toxin-antitoxin system antitoxin component (TIGR02293 family)
MSNIADHGAMPPPSVFDVAQMSAIDAVPVIRAGLPASAYTVLSKVLGLTEAQLGSKLGISPRTISHQRRLRARLSPESTQKLVRGARIQQLGRKIFRTDQAVSQWLASPAQALGGQAPIDLLDTDVGAQEVVALLNGIAYGNVM